jgi:hypothetical protein
MDFKKYIHERDELLGLFRRIDEEYNNWTEEQDRGITVSLDEFYQKRGFIDFEDFSITMLMYNIVNDINMNMTDETEQEKLSKEQIETIRYQRLNTKINQYYEDIRICLNSRN